MKKSGLDLTGDVMNQFFRIIWFLFIISLPPSTAWCENIKVLTTTWTPYVYGKTGNVAGMGTEIVRAVLNKANVEGEIQSLSWNRAMLIAQKEKNILIYPLMRIEQREDNYIWVAPLFEAKLSLFRLTKNDQIMLKNLAEAQNYTIGVLKGAAMHRFLLSNGFKDGQQLHVFYENRNSIEMLFRERIDLVADNPLVVSHEVKQLINLNQDVGYSLSKIKEILPLTQGNAYMAFGKGSSPELVARLEEAWKELASQGEIEKIISRYR